MLSYDDALTRVLASVPNSLPAETVPLSDAPGRALAEDLLAPCDLPAFDNSMVDGYAVRLKTTSVASPDIPLTLPVTGEVAAGSAPGRALLAGEAWRIFTGAPLPEGADAVVMVEDTEEEDGWATLTHGGSAKFIRRRGSDIVVGALAVPGGATLGAGEVALLAALNVFEIRCPRKPRVGLLSTGDELVPVGETPLGPGQIRDANGPALAAAIAEAGAILVAHRHARDTPEAIHEALDALSECDVILSSGGVSVGDHDHVKAVLEARGTLDFWRIAIKPGKPLAFGNLSLVPPPGGGQGGLFFGLPGNPASALVTFELFVRPALRKLAGHTRPLRPEIRAQLTQQLAHAPGRREFVRAGVTWQGGIALATPTGEQASHRTHSLVGADALLVAHEERGDYAAGEVLPALWLG